MNVPAIAKKTFDELRSQTEYSTIVSFVVKSLNKISKPFKRARFIHQLVDEYNEEVFSHELVKKLSPCTLGCTACCHSQVSCTEDEAELLAKRVAEGTAINYERLKLQAAAQENSVAFFSISYQDRKCVFLSEEGRCTVYEDRPSVCRTNAVLGDKAQCDTQNGPKPLRLVKTAKADMVIYASYLGSNSSGTLPQQLYKALQKKDHLPK